MKSSLITILLLLQGVVLFAQPFGNEWINFDQDYYKLPVGEDGLYRVTYEELADAGVPVATIDPRRVQLWHRGVEQAIRVEGQVDARWDPGDYLEFYGFRNDGTLDAEIYREGAQPHTYFNLFSDTTVYFLTWRLDNGNGRRMEDFSQNNVDNLPAEPSYQAVSRKVFVNSASLGRAYPQGSVSAETYLSAFDFGEGWTGGALTRGQAATLTFSDITNGVSSAGAPQLRLILQGRNNREHNVSIQVGPDADNLRDLTTAAWSFYNVEYLTQPLEWSDISADGQLLVRYQVNGVNGIADRMSVSVAEVVFPQAWDLQEASRFTFAVQPSSTPRTYVEAVGVAEGARFFDVTQPAAPVEIGYNRSGTDINFMLEASGDSIALRMESAFLTAVPERITFREYPATPNYLLITIHGLRVSAGGYAYPVEAFAAYRASFTGGDYDTLIANVTELYNQFSYGEISPLAIQRFMAYQLSRGNPEYLFLVGKSRYWFNAYHRQANPSQAFPSWFPAAGYPGSDALYTYELNGVTGKAAVATGRLNALDAEDVAVYLEKVKSLEASGFDDPWRKRLLHLSGGATPFELSSFAQYVNEFAGIAEEDFLGAEVETFSKTSDAVVEVINVSDEVNDGVGVLLMFGHSGAQRTDIDIGFVSNPLFGFSNTGRYPLILVNGCNAGDIFQGFETFGEDWITTPDLGASSVIAHSATGFSNELRDWSRTFYRVGFADNTFFGSSIAEVMQEVSVRYLEAEGVVSERELSQVQQMVLQGDPAVKLFGPSQPDVRLAANGASLQPFEGLSVSANADSIRLQLLVENAGITTQDSLWITVSRTLPTGEMVATDTVPYPAPRFLDTLSFTLPNTDLEVAGLNRFTIYLDPGDSIAEFNEANNVSTLEAFVPAGTHLNLLPENRSVVGSTSVTLLAQASDLLAPARSLIFQLDTVRSFTSGFLQSTTVNSAAVMQWSVELPDEDSVVYHWRTRFAELETGEDTAWQEFSFVYVGDGTPGWAQAHPGQFQDNVIDGLVLGALPGSWQFPTTEVPLEILTYGDSVPGVNRTDIQVTISGQPYIFPVEDGLDSIRFCRDNSLNAIAFDRQSGFPYLVIDNGGFDVLNANSCGRRPQIINNFLQGDITGDSRELNRYVNGVNEDDWVLFFTVGTIDPSAWPADVLDALAEVGVNADSLLNVGTSEAFVFLGQKRTDPTIFWQRATSTVTLDVATSVFGQFTEGNIQSPRIGPATSWGDVFIPSVPLTGEDAIQFDLYGILPNGEDSLLIADVDFGTTSLAGFDAEEWPTLRLRVRMEDEDDFSPPPFEEWWVSYTAPPEGILLPAAPVEAIAVQEGESVTFPFRFVNVSGIDFPDSLEVTYSVTNQLSRGESPSSTKLSPVPAGDTVHFLFATNTVGLAGMNDLAVEVNGNGVVTEQSLVNNFLQLDDLFEVSRDSIHPLIDVTVEGRYILDGELVSPSPLILVRLKDENTLLRKTDTVGVQLFFKTPGQSEFTRIAFTDPRVVWTPASEEQDFRLEFLPTELEDGVYTLRVQATDATGNESGIEPYQISFSVENESSITRFYPYPNPFSTACRFVFTLTGSTIPDEIKIQILTVSGKVVREITQDELGPIHIGNNLTEFAWDGTDTWGQKLANGVYLYRVIVRNGGEALDLRAPNAELDERAFNRDYGKLYILR
ncbi:MAG: C25 family cysteine peptidase [Bacteroidota bacterium]